MKYLTVKNIEKGISFGLLDSEKKDSLKIEEFKEVKELTPENFRETYKKYSPEAIEDELYSFLVEHAERSASGFNDEYFGDYIYQYMSDNLEVIGLDDNDLGYQVFKNFSTEDCINTAYDYDLIDNTIWNYYV